MSLFLGKDNIDDNVMHLTSGHTNLEDMKSITMLPSTIFHSKLPIMTVKKFDALSITYAGAYTPVQYSSGYTGKHYYLEFDSEAINYMLNTMSNPMVFDVIISGIYNNTPYSYSVRTVSHYSVINGIHKWYDVNQNPFTAKGQPFVGAKYIKIGVLNDPNAPLTAHLMVYNIDIFGNYLNNFALNGGDVKINNTSISIGNIDMFSKSYISNTIINDNDFIFSDHGGTRQLLNSSATSDGIEIKNTTNGIEIYNGTNKMFDTNANMVTFGLHNTQTLHKNTGDFYVGNLQTKNYKLFDIPIDAVDIIITIQSLSGTTNNSILNFSVIKGTTPYYVNIAYYYEEVTEGEARTTISFYVTSDSVYLHISCNSLATMMVGEANYILTVTSIV